MFIEPWIILKPWGLQDNSIDLISIKLHAYSYYIYLLVSFNVHLKTVLYCDQYCQISKTYII